jgi:hypothetical protein
MATRIMPDADKPSISIEISLEKPLPDYDIEQIEHPAPRDVDGVLVSQGFRDVVDDARGVLLEILNEPEKAPDDSSEMTDLDLTPAPTHPLEIAQMTGAICPGDDEIYRPGLWIVLEDRHAAPREPLPATVVERVKRVAGDLVRRMDLD